MLVTGELPTAGASDKSKAQQTQILTKTRSAWCAAAEEILTFSGIPIRDKAVQRSSYFQPIKDLTGRLLAPEWKSPEIAGRDYPHRRARMDKYKETNEGTRRTILQPLHQRGPQRSLAEWQDCPMRVGGGWS